MVFCQAPFTLTYCVTFVHQNLFKVDATCKEIEIGIEIRLWRWGTIEAGTFYLCFLENSNIYYETILQVGNRLFMWAWRELFGIEHDSQDCIHPNVLLLPKCGVDTVL